MKSLFIVSLPRSLSSLVHQACCEALDLRSPGWTTAGEIMNFDRSVMAAGRNATGLKYILPKYGPIFVQSTEFLSHVYLPCGFAYKDVVQPFVVATWLRENPDIPVLKIRPNIAHVAMAMLRKQWLYPTVGAVRRRETPGMMVEGLLRAASALEAIPGESVSYDDLVLGFDDLWAALRRLYPGQELRPFALPQDFQANRREVLDRRGTAEFEELHRLLDEIGSPMPNSATIRPAVAAASADRSPSSAATV